ncbi:hypothetical protein Ddc_05542 [Ditylenchus destructor]|nr:hypothetical protein Ddc_05542 [Ditylenchus destructor]
MLEWAKFMHSSDRQTAACSLPAFMLERRGQRPNPHKKSRNPIEEKNWQHCSQPALWPATKPVPAAVANPRANEMWQQKSNI